jgi:hypothetical protein
MVSWWYATVDPGYTGDIRRLIANDWHFVLECQVRIDVRNVLDLIIDHTINRHIRYIRRFVLCPLEAFNFPHKTYQLILRLSRPINKEELLFPIQIR